MPNPMKIVDNVVIEMTDEEVAAQAAFREEIDLDMSGVRSDRNGRLSGSDWTRLDDATLGDHTAEEWATYRQALRDLPATYSRVSEVVWPEDPPTAKISRKVAAGNAASITVVDDGGTPEEAQAAYDTAYAATD